MNITVKDLLDAGVHFGHQTRRWNPKSRPFIFDHRNGISIIDLEKTHAQLEIAAKAAEDIVASGKDILFVATKRQAQDIMREAAKSLNQPFAVNRWLGGAVTNWATVKGSLDKYRSYLKLEQEGFPKILKKEAAQIKREMVRMQRNFEGMLDLRNLPGAIFVIDTKNEEIAVAEAGRAGIPVIGLVDTNADPSKVTYPIPGNDDAVKSVRIIVQVIADAIQAGLARREVERASRPAPRGGFGSRNADQGDQPEVNIDPSLMKDAPSGDRPGYAGSRPGFGGPRTGGNGGSRGNGGPRTGGNGPRTGAPRSR